MVEVFVTKTNDERRQRSLEGERENEGIASQQTIIYRRKGGDAFPPMIDDEHLFKRLNPYENLKQIPSTLSLHLQSDQIDSLVIKRYFSTSN